MFKKPLSHLKTSAPLRSSDRRKLKQHVVDSFSLTAEDGEDLVPDGILAAKFSTHLGDPGVMYLSPDGGTPLWFSLGKNPSIDKDEIVPTVYTLWKRPHLLPSLSTPASVIPVLSGGADLMIPGVTSLPSAVAPHQLVSVAQHPFSRPALAVGHLTSSSAEIRRGGKGKAVKILHAWKDSLWAMGGGGDVPPGIVRGQEEHLRGEEHGMSGEATEEGVRTDDVGAAQGGGIAQARVQDAAPIPGETAPGSSQAPAGSRTPEECSDFLHNALLQSLSTTLSSPPAGLLPLASGAFYSSYVLPFLPFHASDVTVKTSSYKNLSAFLKRCEKDGLVKLKDTKEGPVVVSVSPQHQSVASHVEYRTVKDEAEKKETKEKRERASAEKGGKGIEVKEIWRAAGGRADNGPGKWLSGVGEDPAAYYTAAQLRAILANYIAAHSLINPHEGAYVKVDELLGGAVGIAPTLDAMSFPVLNGSTSASSSTPAGTNGPQSVAEKRAKKREVKRQTASGTGETVNGEEWFRREDLLQRLLGQMQACHEIRLPGREDGSAIMRKGAPRPIVVSAQTRAGRKAVSTITGFELFGLDGEVLAEELRVRCAGATSVSPLPGKNAGNEVLVQGRHFDAIIKLLEGKGVPKKWIEAKDDAKSKGGKGK